MPLKERLFQTLGKLEKAKALLGKVHPVAGMDGLFVVESESPAGEALPRGPRGRDLHLPGLRPGEDPALQAPGGRGPLPLAPGEAERAQAWTEARAAERPVA